MSPRSPWLKLAWKSSSFLDTNDSSETSLPTSRFILSKERNEYSGSIRFLDLASLFPFPEMALEKNNQREKISGRLKTTARFACTNSPAKCCPPEGDKSGQSSGSQMWPAWERPGGAPATFLGWKGLWDGTSAPCLHTAPFPEQGCLCTVPSPAQALVVQPLHSTDMLCAPSWEKAVVC